MRTTIDIDDDVLTIVKDIARAQKKTAGEVISELTRQALRGPQTAAPVDVSKLEVRDGFLVLPSRGGVVTKEQIDDLIWEADLTEVGFGRDEVGSRA